MSTDNSNSTETLGVVRRGEAYPLRIFLPLAGLKETAWREARKRAEAAGIILDRKIGSTKWVVGDDWLDFLQTVDSRQSKRE